jgi:hypothetical protein
MEASGEHNLEAEGEEPVISDDGEAVGHGRVETILGGWWRRDEAQFRRCRTMDLGLEEGVIVLDNPTNSGDEFELHLDIEAEWSVRLQARTVSSRPIFFGKQHLTRVSYRFLKSTDSSMFGLWLQRQLADKTLGGKEYLKPVARNPARQGEEPVLRPGAKLAFIEDRWRRALSTLKARIPWREAAPVPDDRRTEHRGQVGLALTVLSPLFRFPAELLNVSWSGACIFIEAAAVGRKGWPSPGQAADLMVSDSSLLMGSRRCSVNLVWSEEARMVEGENPNGRAYGLRFIGKGPEIKRTFIGDLLRRLRYDPRQVRKELRFPLAVPVIVRVQGEQLSGRTVDLSAGGARLLLEGTVTTPNDGFIELTLPDSGRGQRISLSMRFLREVAGPEGGYCYAVAFRQAQPEAHLKLSRWLATRMRVQTLDELVPELSPPQSQAFNAGARGDRTVIVPYPDPYGTGDLTVSVVLDANLYDEGDPEEPSGESS